MYPRWNVQIEKTIQQTVKKLLKKCVESGEDVQSALVDYCNTPVVDGLTPAQILMNRRLRTKVPIAKKLLKPSLCDPNNKKL